MLIRIAMVLTSGLLATTFVAAQPVYQAHRCDNCGGSAQMQGVAIQHGIGTRYVYSLATAEVRKFDVERWCGDNPQSATPETEGRDVQLTCTWWQHIAIERAVEHQVSDLVAEVSSVFHALGGSLVYTGVRDLGSVQVLSEGESWRSTGDVPPGSQ